MSQRNKFHNKKIEANGLKFDSKLEYNRYLYLLDLQKKGIIFNLRTQVTFPLLPKYLSIHRRVGKNGKMLKPKYRILANPSTYTADFVYEVIESVVNEEERRTIVEDTKGYATELFNTKKKMMLFIHNIIVHIIKKATDPIPEDIEYFADYESTDIDSEPQ